jgi:DNA-binding NtrC family response regulator
MADIVVVDSEETVRSVVERILRRAGHSVRATGDFNEALQILRQSRADLVLTNVFLRGIAGHDAMLRLKTDFPGIPVLMMSGVPDASVIREWVEQAQFDIFPKPFMPDSLIHKIEEVLKTARSAA